MSAAETASGPTAGSVRAVPLAVAGVAAAATWAWTSGGEYTLANVAAWSLTLAAWLVAWWPRAEDRAADAGRRPRLRLERTWPEGAALAGVLVLGAVLRLYRLSEVPGEPTSDHAEKLLDLQTIEHGEHPIFFQRNTGREPAQFYLTSWLSDVIGEAPTFDTLKLGTALVGAVAVGLVYLLARELFGARAGLIAALLLAVSQWPIAITRTGLRHGYGPLAAALALWLAFRYLRTRDRRDALLCGVALGAGLHGYTAFRIVPPLVLLLVALVVLADVTAGRRARAARGAADALLVAWTTALAALPLLHYALGHPDRFWERSSSRLDGGVPRLVENLWNALLAFHGRGDDTSVTLERHVALLDPLTGAALAVGAVVLVVRVVRERDRVAALVLAAFPALLLPSALSLAFPAENPSAARLGVAAPLVFAVAGLALERAIAVAGRAGRPVAAMAVAAAGAVVAGAVATTFTSYFRDFDRQYRAFVPNAQEVAAALRPVVDRGTPLHDVYLAGSPYWVDARNIGFALGDPDWYVTNGILPGQAVPRPAGRRIVVVALAGDVARARELRRAYPNAEPVAVASEVPGKDFVLYVVGAGTGG